MTHRLALVMELVRCPPLRAGRPGSRDRVQPQGQRSPSSVLITGHSLAADQRIVGRSRNNRRAGAGARPAARPARVRRSKRIKGRKRVPMIDTKAIRSAPRLRPLFPGI